MQPRVSMVMPCYNKAMYIGRMFDSILAQKWDNIELILVNDGSTDGTREIIADYIHKFKARGFKVVVVDQENKGLPGAVYEGLKRITGKFVCQVDADDELEPEYVSAMADFLEREPGYDWAVCDMVRVGSKGCEYQSYRNGATPESVVMENLAECFLLGRIKDTVPRYLVRTDYLKRSGLVENYYYDLRRTQEPQFALPLAVAGGRLKYIASPFYRHLENETMMSKRKTYEDYAQYHEQYHAIAEATVNQMKASPPVKTRLLALVRFARLKRRILNGIYFRVGENQVVSDARDGLLEFLNREFSPPAAITEALQGDMPYLIQATEDNILGVTAGKLPQKPTGRVIAWGALGARGRRLLPALRGTPLEPTELWDAAGDGAAVKKPAPGSLNSNDLALVLPVKDNAEEICAALEPAGCAIMLSDELAYQMAHLKYPRFYDGSVKFNHKGV